MDAGLLDARIVPLGTRNRNVVDGDVNHVGRVAQSATSSRVVSGRLVEEKLAGGREASLELVAEAMIPIGVAAASPSGQKLRPAMLCCDLVEQGRRRRATFASLETQHAVASSSRCLRGRTPQDSCW